VRRAAPLEEPDERLSGHREDDRQDELDDDRAQRVDSREQHDAAESG
jgi:hypothetical protein